MKGNFAGMPATGRKATWTEIHVSRVRDGKVVEHWGVVDQMGMMMQLGVAPGVPAGSTSG
jgi:predicted ester cyclase